VLLVSAMQFVRTADRLTTYAVGGAGGAIPVRWEAGASNGSYTVSIPGNDGAPLLSWNILRAGPMTRALAAIDRTGRLFVYAAPYLYLFHEDGYTARQELSYGVLFLSSEHDAYFLTGVRLNVLWGPLGDGEQRAQKVDSHYYQGTDADGAVRVRGASVITGRTTVV
jgi:hypothetical protein